MLKSPLPPEEVGKLMLSIRKDGISARGRTELIKFHTGRRLTPMQSIRAKCYDCMGYYADGKRDCGQVDCPLHRFMPYALGVADEEPDDEDLDVVAGEEPDDAL